MIFVIPVRHAFQSYPHSFVGIDNTSIFGLAFPQIAASFSSAMCWCFIRHCRWHRNFQLSTSVFFMVCLNSSSSGSMKKIQRDCLALSSFGFSIAHFWFCFALSLHQTYDSTYLATQCRVLRSFVSSSVSPGPCISFRWPFVNKNESCEACRCI